MLNIVLLAGNATYQASATGTIANKYFDILSKKHNVKVLFSATTREQLENIPQNYFPVIDPLINFYLSKARKVNPTNMFIVRMIRRVQRFFNHDIVMSWYYKNGLSVLKTMNESNKIDLLISISSPFVTHKLANKFSKLMAVPWISIVIDPLTNKKSLFNFCYYRYEKKTFESSNYCLFTKELITSKIETYKKHKIKFKYLPYLIPDNTKNIPSRKTDHYTLIYQGSFYKGIREPYYFLEVISKLPHAYKVKIYTKGKYEDVVRKYSKMYPNIEYGGYISKSALKDALLQSDFFINIANDSPAYAPSKIFEYISYGKPIISFGHKNRVDSYLAKYPISLVITQNEVTPECAAQRIDEFCHENLGRSIDFNHIKDIFNENTESSIEALFDKCIQDVIS